MMYKNQTQDYPPLHLQNHLQVARMFSTSQKRNTRQDKSRFDPNKDRISNPFQ